MSPKKIHKISYPKIINFLQTQKNIEIQKFWTPQKMTPAYVCKKISEYHPPPPDWDPEAPGRGQNVKYHLIILA